MHQNLNQVQKSATPWRLAYNKWEYFRSAGLDVLENRRISYESDVQGGKVISECGDRITHEPTNDSSSASWGQILY